MVKLDSVFISLCLVGLGIGVAAAVVVDDLELVIVVQSNLCYWPPPNNGHLSITTGLSK
jgi:hypothetical protein